MLGWKGFEMRRTEKDRERLNRKNKKIDEWSRKR
jgi:hypothetical protein